MFASAPLGFCAYLGRPVTFRSMPPRPSGGGEVCVGFLIMCIVTYTGLGSTCEVRLISLENTIFASPDSKQCMFSAIVSAVCT